MQTVRPGRYVLSLEDVDRTQVALVGGKGANLGELSHLDGVRVPAGFCVTTDAYRRIVADSPTLGDQLDRLSRLGPDDRESIGALSADIRQTLEGVALPDELSAEVVGMLVRLGERSACAVRSSATTEDLPAASFAGQHDTYLNIVGRAAVLGHLNRCWASLFTDRAVSYRLRHGVDHRAADMAVIVQRMAAPQASGVLFTADPVTSNRTVASVEAVFGLGEALVAGRVSPDVYKVRDDALVMRSVASEHLAVHASPGGGTREHVLTPERRHRPVLTDAQAVRLAQVGRRIEAHFGCPQDIEWCMVDDELQIVQSRPITTLFPIPAAGAPGNRVYVSVGHQQMMTDPMKPLGLSLFQLTALRPMYEAGGRLFVDVTDALASPAGRAGLLEVMGRGDPLIRDALEAIVGRDDFVLPPPDDAAAGPPPAGGPFAGGPPAPLDPDPAIVAELIRRTDASIAAVSRDIGPKSGEALVDFIVADVQELKRTLSEPLSMQVIMVAMEATWWINDRMEAWLGEKGAVDTLTQSVPGNVTSEMGLALLDVADVIRPHPEVVAFLRHVEDDGFLDDMESLPGGPPARDAIRAFLDRYGMRCIGEIDITRPRWSERPTTLVPVILANVEHFEPGARERRFERGRRAAWSKEQELLARLRALPGGDEKAAETKRRIDLVRTFIGYREYPKYGIVSRYFLYKQALLGEAARLVRAGVLRDEEDIFYLTVQELRDVARTREVDERLIARRKEEFRSYQALTPPRVITSDGETLGGSYHRVDVPAGALLGVPVSAGIVEGRARVILDMADADIDPGDILVTTHTDPSWSPLFVTISGLVTEVGGLMTHGAVIAREYGVPAVVGVEHATRVIEDGQRIRVDGSHGHVEIL